MSGSTENNNNITNSPVNTNVFQPQPTTYQRNVKMRMQDNTERYFKVTITPKEQNFPEEKLQHQLDELQNTFSSTNTPYDVIEEDDARIDIKEIDVQTFKQTTAQTEEINDIWHTFSGTQPQQITINKNLMSWTLSTIQNVSTSVFQNFSLAMEHALANKEILKQKEFVVIEQGNDKFLVKLDKNNQIEIHFVGKELGTGGYSVVYATHNLMKGTTHALKIEKKREANVQKEYQIGLELKKLNNGETPEGIQECPKKVVQMSNGLQGLWMKRYSRDYFESINDFIDVLNKFDSYQKEDKEAFINKHLLEEIPIVHQILKGAAFLSKNNYLNGDIKPDNILIDELNKKAHLADLSEIRNMGKMHDEIISGNEIKQRFELEKWSSHYRLIEDINYAKNLKKEGNDKILEYNFLLRIENKTPELLERINTLQGDIQEISKNFLYSEQRRDTFALGCVFYAALSSYSIDPDGDPLKYSDQDLKPLPLPVQNLLKEMLGPSDQRPTPDEVLAKFEQTVLTLIQTT